MQRFGRRDVLRLSGAGLGASAAGCLADFGPQNADTGPGTGAGLEDVEITQYGIAHTPSADDETPDVLVIDSDTRARATVGFHNAGPSYVDEVNEVLRAVDYDESVFVLVTSVGPTTCHHQLEITNVAVEDGTLVGDASIVRRERGACRDRTTCPSALVRATVPEGREPPTDATFSITDAWDETHSVSASADDSLSPDPGELPGYVRPDGDPATVPPVLECATAEFKRLNGPPHVTWGDGRAFSLRVDRLAIDRGDEVTVTMTNVTDERKGTGTARQFGLEVYTEAGWQETRGYTTEHFGYNDEGILHDPGEGFEWTLEMTAAGLDDQGHRDLEVCPDPPAGRYRFVFLSGSIAVAFDLRE